MASDRLQGYHPNIAELLLTSAMYERRMQDISQGGVVGLSKKNNFIRLGFQMDVIITRGFVRGSV